MSFQNDDLLLVNRAGTSFKTEYGLLRERIIEGVGGATVSETEPAGEHEGDLWYQPSTDSLFVWVVSNTTGVVTSVTVRNGGSGYTTNETDVETIGGDGEGLTLDIQAGVGGNYASPTVNQGGSGYAVGNVVFLIGAGNQNGSANVTAINEVAIGAWELVGSGGGGGDTTIEYSGAAAWGRIGGDGSKQGGLNFTSSAGGSGEKVVVFDTPMPNSNYSVVASGFSGSAITVSVSNVTETGFTLTTRRDDGSLASAALAFAVHALNALPPKGGTGADAWCSTSSEGNVPASFNIASVTKSGTGIYDYVFVTPMPNINYTVVATPAAGAAIARTCAVSNKVETGFRIEITNLDGNNANESHYVIVHATNAQLPDTITQEELDTILDLAENPPTGGGATAWGGVNVDGTKFGAGLNFSVVLEEDPGKYRITFDTPMPSDDYAVQATALSTIDYTCVAGDKTATGFLMRTFREGVGLSNIGFTFTVHATNALPPKGGTGADGWARTNSSGNLMGSFNIASVTWNSATSQYDYVFSTPMPSFNYGIVATPAMSDTKQRTAVIGNHQATGFSIGIQEADSGALGQASHCVVVHATNAQLPDTVTQEELLYVDGRNASEATQEFKDGINMSGGTALFTGQTNHQNGIQVIGGTAADVMTGFWRDTTNSYLGIANGAQNIFRVGYGGTAIGSGTISNVQIGADTQLSTTNENIYNVQAIYGGTGHAGQTQFTNVTSILDGDTQCPEVNLFAARIDTPQDNAGVSVYGYYTNIHQDDAPNGSVWGVFQTGDAQNYFMGQTIWSQTSNSAEILNGTKNGKFIQAGDYNLISGVESQAEVAHISFTNPNGVLGSINTAGSNIKITGLAGGPLLRNGFDLDSTDGIVGAVQNVVDRITAIESNEIIDDATDTSLLQLLANASSRLDSIEARLTALEGGN